MQGIGAFQLLLSFYLLRGHFGPMTLQDYAVLAKMSERHFITKQHETLKTLRHSVYTAAKVFTEQLLVNVSPF